ncbi:DUF2381 family protein [Pyxidicoccus caerfyrddinensis]|uniref:DUF2381 family protein n=1 Tax=Pyxidicoccus caerfyrddinensis TaxID=2709663 RepID=UPI0013DD58DC|nr:DUF2381 family protein [Pyxidicoccus caerfyrddinensis]
MLSPFGAVLLTCALLVVPPATAQPEVDPWTPGTRRITLGPRRASPPPKVRISPGVGTVLVFDTAVARVELQERERFGRVRLNEDTLTLLPASNLEAEEELQLTVHFEDDAVPTSADFLLVVHATLAERQVEVFRHPRPAANLQAELEEKEAEVRRLKEEVARLQAAQSRPEGLTGLLAAEHMDDKGVQVRLSARDFVLHRRSALTATNVVTYRAARSFALAVRLEGARGTETWRAEGAALQAKDGTALRVLRVWQTAPHQPGKKGKVVVEAEATNTTSPGPYTLTIWATDGKRPVILGNVQFPESSGTTDVP